MDDVSKLLEKSLRFVSLRLVGLPGYANTRSAKVMIGTEAADTSIFVNPTVRLMPKDWSARFSQVEGLARRVIANASPSMEHSVDLPAVLALRGVSVVAASRAAEVEAAVQAVIDKEFEQAKKEFIAAYEGIIADVQKKINNASVWESIKGKIPTKKALEGRLSLRFDKIPITFLSEKVNAEASATAQAIFNGIAGAILEEAGNIQTRLNSEKGRFRLDSFNELKRQMELLKSFSFLTSDESLAKLEEVERTMNAMGKDPHTVLNAATAASSGVAKLFGNTLSALGQSLSSGSELAKRRKILAE